MEENERKMEIEENKKRRKDGREIRKRNEKIEERSDGKKILLLTKCEGHSLVQRWDGKICTKGSKFYMSC